MENKILCSARKTCGDGKCKHKVLHSYSIECAGTCFRLRERTDGMTTEEVLALPKPKCREEKKERRKK